MVVIVGSYLGEWTSLTNILCLNDFVLKISFLNAVAVFLCIYDSDVVDKTFYEFEQLP